ncbi:hypothetical protein HanIR_Chr10g0462421 [Helianthus annuus]|nr:hypothetical protein HanIR_Chr10g0462421 [Helianthus annuus]
MSREINHSRRRVCVCGEALTAWPLHVAGDIVLKPDRLWDTDRNPSSSFCRQRWSPSYTTWTIGIQPSSLVPRNQHH